MGVVKSFEKFGDLKKPKVLILGTLPGENSTENGKYFNDNRNKFWEILGSILNEKDLKSYDYETQKRKVLEENHIMLWDMYAQGERQRFI